jgi:hypothetical protein
MTQSRKGTEGAKELKKIKKEKKEKNREGIPIPIAKTETKKR